MIFDDKITVTIDQCCPNFKTTERSLRWPMVWEPKPTTCREFTEDHNLMADNLLIKHLDEMLTTKWFGVRLPTTLVTPVILPS